MNYTEFLAQRAQNKNGDGFAPKNLPDFLYPFQHDLTDWALRRGKAAIFADCGLGKTPMQLVWADQVVRHTNSPVLIAAPLAVSHQVVHEGEKFGIEVSRVTNGPCPNAQIYVTNYERLHLFDPSEFSGLVCDESSILKNFDGIRRGTVQEFLRTLRFRLLCTATAAPNDYTELGTSSEALGELGHLDMLMRYFKNQQGVLHAVRVREGAKWRFKHHAEIPFWRWVSSWARAIRKPSDYGYDDGQFQLPPLKERDHFVDAKTVRDGWLFDMPATNFHEEREERRRTIRERCEQVVELVADTDQSIVWCHLNDEGDFLEQSINGAVQVSGSDSDEAKEERLWAFANGEIRVLVTKPKIGAWGLNLQRCAHVTFFPSHSYEQYYQAVRRCWRFGQARPVIVDIVATEGQRRILENLKRKAVAATRMFDALVTYMADSTTIQETTDHSTKIEAPTWV